MKDPEAPIGRIVVLDIETEPNPAAVAIAPKGGPANRPALHRLTGYSMLSARETEERNWTDLALHTRADVAEYDLLLDLDAKLTSAIADGATLVTYNGLASDLPIIARRQTAHWLFALPGLTGLGAMPHRDLMREATRIPGSNWPSLRDQCAALGIPMDHALVPAHAEPTPPAHRKSQVDVVATFLLAAHDLSARRGEARTVSRAWVALADLLRRREVRAPHLAQFVFHPQVQRARVEADCET